MEKSPADTTRNSSFLMPAQPFAFILVEDFKEQPNLHLEGALCDLYPDYTGSRILLVEKNDGGLALGQVLAGRWRLAGGGLDQCA